jgi:hypothetical protein
MVRFAVLATVAGPVAVDSGSSPGVLRSFSSSDPSSVGDLLDSLDAAQQKLYAALYSPGQSQTLYEISLDGIFTAVAPLMVAGSGPTELAGLAADPLTGLAGPPLGTLPSSITAPSVVPEPGSALLLTSVGVPGLGSRWRERGS